MPVPTTTRAVALLLSTTLAAPAVFAQQNDHWFFGHSAGIDFTSGTATPLTGTLDALEGTATMSGPDGSLLFYTEGTTVWDRNGNVMPHGNGLFGGASSTQAALIVPKPGDCGKYYVFTSQDHTQVGDIYYSLVDMCLNGGLGDVVAAQKNVLVASTCAEKLTAVPRPNSTDVWVIGHALGSANFLSFRVSTAGVASLPVISTVGSVTDATCMIGAMKASHSGRHLVSVTTFCNTCELFDFDPNTGVLSNAVDLTSQFALPSGLYGVEFSPDDQLIYLSQMIGNGRVYQLDRANAQLLQLTDIPGTYFIGALQLGPDGRIYVARKDEAFLDVIAAPDVPGIGCTYQPAGFALQAGTTSDIGLPNMVPSTVLGPQLGGMYVDLGADTTSCNTLPFTLNAPGGCSPTYAWQDGSTASTFSVTSPGTYWVHVTDACGDGADTIDVLPPNVVVFDLGPDTAFCPGGNVTFTVPAGLTATWQDGSSTNTFIAQQTGTYSAHVTNTCGGSADDTVSVVAHEFLQADLGPDVHLCPDDQLLLSSPAGASSVLWSDGSTGATFTVSAGGTYWLRVVGPCNTTSDTLVVTQVSQDQLDEPMANVFTPNGDGTNDVFHVPDLFRVVNLTIFDRWGHTIYATDLPADGWNGRTGNAGEPVPQGTYFYVVERHSDCTDEVITDHGTVTLLR